MPLDGVAFTRLDWIDCDGVAFSIDLPKSTYREYFMESPGVRYLQRVSAANE